MGLFSKFKHPKEECAPAVARNDPKITTTPPSTNDESSSMASPNVSLPSYTPSASTSTPSKAPPPGYGSSSNSNWPAVPHAGDYKARIAQMEEDAKAQPHTHKSWLKEKFDLVDPTEPEYYERRFKASGNGSDYEQASRLAMLAGGGGGGGLLL